MRTCCWLERLGPVYSVAWHGPVRVWHDGNVCRDFIPAAELLFRGWCIIVAERRKDVRQLLDPNPIERPVRFRFRGSDSVDQAVKGQRGWRTIMLLVKDHDNADHGNSEGPIRQPTLLFKSTRDGHLRGEQVQMVRLGRNATALRINQR